MEISSVWFYLAADMKILVVGKGGREHALLTAFDESPTATELYSFPGSDAIAEIATLVDVDGLESLIAWMKGNDIELCVAGEESYLVTGEGLANLCEKEGIPCWGPHFQSAQLEASKEFAKEFMLRHEIPTGAAAGCAEGEFTCNDGSCIPGSWECDVNWCDCADCEDEADCGGRSADGAKSLRLDEYNAKKLAAYNYDQKMAEAQTAVNLDDSMVAKSIGKHNAKNPADVIKKSSTDWFKHGASVGRKAAPEFESKLQRANSVKLIQTAEGLKYEADGYVGFEITLEHGADFEINVTESSFIADYKTTGNTTKVIVVAPETENLFSSTGDYTIIDVIAGTNGGEALSANIVLVTEFGLSNAYPNPFNPTTSVKLGIPADGFVSVKIYNIMGQVVATLHEGDLTANSYTFTWDAGNVASGMYFLKAETAGNVDVQKIMLMK